MKGTSGKPATWAIEGGAPNTLYRAGWRKDSLKIGDVVTVHGYLARDGHKLANMRDAILADGRPVLGGQQDADLSVALGSQPPFTDFGAERWRTVDTAKDPTGHCLPVGPSRGFTAPFPFLLVQGADTVSILFEYQAIWRAIYLDGRGHPEDVAEYPYFMGHSVGHWEGDTLVVDTTGIDERSWLDTAGHEHSAKLRLTERFQKKTADTMQWTATYDDPVYFTSPWSITRTFTRGKPGDRLLPYTCNENNKDVEHLRTHQPNLDYKHTPVKPKGN